MSELQSNDFLVREKPGRLMMNYAVPCIISLLVAALYNIVDQIFIANATYLGSYGNAANTVVFPLTVVALAIAVMIGDGACAFVSISLGAGKGAVPTRRRRVCVERRIARELYQGYPERRLRSHWGRLVQDKRPGMIRGWFGRGPSAAHGAVPKGFEDGGVNIGKRNIEP